MDFIHSTWILVRRSDHLRKQNYYWSDGDIVDQKIYTWIYVWMDINPGCYYKVFNLSLNKRNLIDGDGDAKNGKVGKQERILDSKAICFGDF